VLFKFMSADCGVSHDEAHETRPDFHLHRDLRHHASLAGMRSVGIVFHSTVSTNGDHEVTHASFCLSSVLRIFTFACAEYHVRVHSSNYKMA
jgi:hypothetical protein